MSDYSELAYALEEELEDYSGELHYGSQWHKGEGSIDHNIMWEYTVYLPDVKMTKTAFCQHIVEAKSRVSRGCTHEYDCCGCWFRMYTNVTEEVNPAQKGQEFTVREVWGKNY